MTAEYMDLVARATARLVHYLWLSWPQEKTTFHCSKPFVDNTLPFLEDFWGYYYEHIENFHLFKEFNSMRLLNSQTFGGMIVDSTGKTADDLAASIMDGRYEEQKFRLKNCGINNVIYLVEGTPGQYCKIPEAVLRKACIHTQIFHGFNVMRIPTIQESLKWLTQMTKETAYRMNLTKRQMAMHFE